MAPVCRPLLVCELEHGLTIILILPKACQLASTRLHVHRLRHCCPIKLFEVPSYRLIYVLAY
jgi:hypothetical protein